MCRKTMFKTFCLTLIFAFLFVPAAIAAGKVVIKISAVHPSTYPGIRALNEKFKPMIEELSKGRIEVQVFDNAQLGGERDLMEQLQGGVLQMAYVSPVLGAIDPAINVLDLPFLFMDESHVDKVLDSQIGLDLLKGLPAKGLIPLAYFENGFRVTTNSRRPVNTLADLAGLKIRTPEAPISVAIFKALGANVTPLSFAELYSALQQKVVDGQENAYNTVSSSRYFEVQKYVAETNHMWGCFVVLASARWWNGLDQDLKDIVSAASKEASKYQRQIFRSLTAESKETCIKNGMEVTVPDRAELVKAVQSVYNDFFKTYPQYKDVVEQIKAM